MLNSLTSMVAMDYQEMESCVHKIDYIVDNPQYGVLMVICRASQLAGNMPIITNKRK